MEKTVYMIANCTGCMLFNYIYALNIHVTTTVLILIITIRSKFPPLSKHWINSFANNYLSIWNWSKRTMSHSRIWNRNKNTCIVLH